MCQVHLKWDSLTLMNWGQGWKWRQNFSSGRYFILSLSCAPMWGSRMKSLKQKTMSAGGLTRIWTETASTTTAQSSEVTTPLNHNNSLKLPKDLSKKYSQFLLLCVKETLTKYIFLPSLFMHFTGFLWQYRFKNGHSLEKPQCHPRD